MKRFLPTLLFFALLFSCSKDVQNNEENIIEKTNLKACITFETKVVSVLDRIKIFNCSEEAATFQYKTSKGVLDDANAKEPELYVSDTGEYTVTLEARDRFGNVDTTTQIITVIEPGEYFSPITETDSERIISAPLGINPINDKLYFLESAYLGSGSRYKTTYKEMGNDFTIESTIKIDSDKPYTVTPFIDFLPNGYKNFYLSDFSNNDHNDVFISFDAAGNQETFSSFSANYNGMLKVEGKHLLYGVKKDSQNMYRATVEVTDGNGEILQTVQSEIGIHFSWLTALIPSKNGFVGYGSTYSDFGEIVLSNSFIIFYDQELNEVSHKILEYTPIDNDFIFTGNLGRKHFISELDNGNFVVFYEKELKVLDSLGEELKSIAPTSRGFTREQALFSNGDSFIVSSDKYLTKYDMDGNEIKRLRYGGEQIHNFVEFQGNLLFAAQFGIYIGNSENGYRQYEDAFGFGMVDKDLNLIDLTP